MRGFYVPSVLAHAATTAFELNTLCAVFSMLPVNPNAVIAR
jgi:hypothetical protein